MRILIICINRLCPLRRTCGRFTDNVEPDKDSQLYRIYHPETDNSCSQFVYMEEL